MTTRVILLEEVLTLKNTKRSNDIEATDVYTVCNHPRVNYKRLTYHNLSDQVDGLKYYSSDINFSSL